MQEKLKLVRYAKNSTIHITHQNFDTVPRSHNIRNALGKIYKCPVKVCVLVFGAFVESVGIKGLALKKLLKSCSFSVCESSAKMIIRRLNRQ